MPGFNQGVRQGSNEGRLKIGKDCVLGCTVTFETEQGKVIIGDRTYIGGGTHLICAKEIIIGSDVLFAWGCTVVDHDSHSLNWEERSEDVRLWREGLLKGGIKEASRLKNWSVVPMENIFIGDKVWVGFNVIILKGISIGEGAIIAAGSVVTKDVPAWTVAAGNPARVIRDVERIDG